MALLENTERHCLNVVNLIDETYDLTKFEDIPLLQKADFLACLQELTNSDNPDTLLRVAELNSKINS